MYDEEYGVEEDELVKEIKNIVQGVLQTVEVLKETSKELKKHNTIPCTCW